MKNRSINAMRLSLYLLSWLLSTVAQAAPFVVSDPLDARATHCGMQMDGAARVDVPVAIEGADKRCKFDLAGLSVGLHTVNATAVAVDPAWGRLVSAPSANFTFAVPSIPIVPSGLKLLP